MTTINDAFINALLADAAYVSNLDIATTPGDLKDTLSGRMTPDLAEYIANNFTVKEQFDGTSSFSAVVWVGNAGTPYAGQTYVSMRGTQEGPDFIQDVNLALAGLPHYQLVDMVNWWLRVTTPTTDMAKQVGLDPNSLTYRFIEAPSIQGTGELAEINTIKSANGHSLGGYLATAFDRLFGNKWPIDAVNTFNSAGFSRPMSSNIDSGFEQLSQVIGHEVGLYSFDEITPAEQNNYYALNGINVTTNTWDPIGFNQYGTRIGLFQEDLTPGAIDNHYMYKLTDLLALGNMLEKLDPSMELTRLSALVKVGSNQMIESYESMLAGLRKMLLGENASPTIVGDANADNVGPQPPARISFHQHLSELMALDAQGNSTGIFASLAGKVVISTLPATASAARTGFGEFLSLYYLTPFTLHVAPEAEAILQSSQGMIAINWNIDKNLTDEDRANGKAYFSDAYLTDRAEMLRWIIKRNKDDIVDTTISANSNQLYRVIDGATTVTEIRLGSVLTGDLDRQRFLFGGSNNDTVNGGAKNDHLYGGGGADAIYGREGNDYLEGNDGGDVLYGGEGRDTLLGGEGIDILEGEKGNDSLFGGEGNDTYRFKNGDGWDAIVDSDGIGTIEIGSDTLDGGKETAAGSGVWISSDNKYRYSITDNADGTKTLIISSGADHITVKNFTDGDLGIALGLGKPVVQTPANRTIVGDLAPVDTDPAEPGMQYGYDDLGNVLVSGDEPGRSDILYDSTGDDLIQAKGGDDVVDAKRGGKDRIEGGAGKDILYGGAGNDVLLGGIDEDVLHGGRDDDRLYVNEEVDLAVAIDQGNEQEGSGLKGDWLNGSYGDDIVIAGADNDAVFGGKGSDILVGGAGDDILNGDDEYTALDSDWYTTTVSNEFDIQYWNIKNENSDVLATGDDPDAGDDVLYGGSGNDHIIGLHGEDTLHGDDGNDTLSGEDGNDMLFGGDGDDRMSGDVGLPYYSSGVIASQGDDFLDGGKGSDFLQGEGGNDQLIGGEGNDTIWGDAKTYSDSSLDGNDFLDGGDGVDVLVGQGGDDTLYGGAEDDQLFGDSDDTPEEKQGDDYLDGEDGDDYLAGDGGKDFLFGGDGSDTLQGGDDDDFLEGEGDDDSIEGGEGSDVMLGGEGNDMLWGDAGADFILGGAGLDTLQGGDDNDELDGGADADILLGDAGDDALQGGDANDELQGGDGNDRLIGDAGNDSLFGEAGNDTLDGGAGADYLDGGAGDDIYLNVGEEDTIFDEVGNNTIHFAGGITMDDIDIAEAEVGGATRQVITVKGHVLKLADGGSLGSSQEYAFSDNTQVNQHVLLGERFFDALNQTGTAGNDDLHGYAGNDVLSGGEGEDHLYGYVGNDILNGDAGHDELAGGVGNDTLAGGGGDDAYIFNAGDGQDVIIDSSGVNRVIFGNGLDAATVQISQNYGEDGNLYLDFDFSNGERLSVANGVSEGVQSFEFNDGTILHIDDVIQRLPGLVSTGTEQSDLLAGSGGDDRLYGYDGNDQLQGRQGNDILDGGAGNDAIEGGLGDDLMTGGAGDDLLIGEDGLDVYRFDLGMGKDAIIEHPGEFSELRLGAGVALINLISQRNGNDLIIAMRDGMTAVALKDFFNSEASNWQIRFADDSIVTMEEFLSGINVEIDSVEKAISTFKNALISQRVDDLVQQGWKLESDGDYHRHSDRLTSLPDGQAIRRIIDETTSLTFEALHSNDNVVRVELQIDDTDEVTSQSSSTYTRIVNSEQRVAFSGGTSDSNTPFFIPAPSSDGVGLSGSGYLIPEGWTPLHVKNTAGQYTGTWLYPPGSFDPAANNGTTTSLTTLHQVWHRLEISPELYAGDADNYITILGGGVADGGGGNDTLIATPDEGTSTTLLYGNDGDDQLLGYDLSEVLIGGRGVDYLDGGDGADTYWVLNEDSIDFIDDTGVDFEEIFDDKIIFGSGVTKDNLNIVYGAFGQTLVLSAPDGTGVEVALNMLEFDGTNVRGNKGIELIEFADGTQMTMAEALALALLHPSQIYNGTSEDDVIYGSDYVNALYGFAGDDWLIGGNGYDTLDGGLGNDELSGGDGKDVYLFTKGFGKDIIADGYANIVRFDATVSPDDVSVGTDQYSLYLSISGTTDKIELSEWFDEEYGQGVQIQFADGTVWNTADLLSRISTTSSEYDDYLEGTDESDLLQGMAGNDWLFGQAGDDVLSGQDGHDYVEGDLGVDIVQGGGGDDEISDWAGNNVLDGGAGNDYMFGDGGASFITGNSGEDSIESFGANSVVAFNAGDGSDTIYIGNALTLSLGNGIFLDDLLLSRDEDDLVLEMSGGESIRLAAILSDYSLVDRPAITLQIIGADIRTYDFNAVLVDFDLAVAQGVATDGWSMSASLASHLLSVSSDQIIGGELAYRYAKDGNLSSLSPDAIRTVLLTDNFGTAAQSVAIDGGPVIIAGGGSKDRLSGTERADTLFGGAGDDLLDGGLGDDTYLINSGDGIDRIADVGGADTILFGDDVTPDSLSLGIGSLLVRYGSSEDAIHIDGFDPANALASSVVENFRFADGSSFTYEQLLARGFDLAGSGSITGTSVNDRITGSEIQDIINAGAGNDTLDGGFGTDTMIGGAGNDIYHIDTSYDSVVEYATEGFDLVNSSAEFSQLGANVEALALLNAARIGYGNSLDNLIQGNVNNNALFGLSGNDILKGGDGDDTLTDAMDNNLLDGGAGNDMLNVAGGNNFVVGGTGHDTITVGPGTNIIAYNRGDGIDVVTASGSSQNTLSLGKGIRYEDISLSKDSNNLVLSTQQFYEWIVFKDWYASTEVRSVSKLQFTIEDTTDYNPGSTNPLSNKKVQLFDFAGLVASFDQAQAVDSKYWSISSALLDFHLGGSDTDALGGDLAYQYAKNGNLSSLSMAPTQTLLADTLFGTTAQNLQNTSALQDISPRLM